MSKQCAKCKNTYELTEFHKQARQKDGHDSYCKSCRKQYTRWYQESNRDKMKVYQNQYYQRNKQRLNANRKKAA